jgi:hypothetical protein
MPKALPLLLLGAGALFVMSKKKGKSGGAVGDVGLPPNLPDMVAPPTKGTAGTSTWKKRQQALVDTGYNVGSSGVDGKPGPDTRAAVREFQSDANILVDGKWGAQTSAAMAEALKMAVQGLGKSYYGTIGAMLSKFNDAFMNLFGDKEEGVGNAPLATQILLELGYDAPDPSWVKRFQGDFNAWKSAWAKELNINAFENELQIDANAMRSLIKTSPKLAVNGAIDANTISAAQDADFVEGLMASRVTDGDWHMFIEYTKKQLGQA